MKQPALASVLAVVLFISLTQCGSGGGLSITQVSPSKGSSRGGESVVITGNGFGTAPNVKFGGVAARVNSAYDNEIRVLTPKHAAGPTTIDVEVAGAKARLDAGFTFEPIALAFVDVSWKQLSPLIVNGAGVDVAGNTLVQALRTDGVAIYRLDGGVTVFQPAPPVIDAGVPDAGSPDAGPSPDGGVDAGAKPDAGTKPDAGIKLDSGFPDGGFKATGSGSDLVTVVARDFDQDGLGDLFLGSTSKTPPQLLYGTGVDSFATGTLPASFGSNQTAVASDLDGDGDLDLVLTGNAELATAAPHVTILVNNGSRKFTDATDRLAGAAFDATAVATGDVDGDGDVDLFFTSATEACRLYLGDGRGSFQRASPDAVPIDGRASAAAIGDLNGDDKPDIYLASATKDRVWLNDGTGRYRDATDTTLGTKLGGGYRVVLADLDLDGALDVVVIDRPGKLRLFRNDGKGRLFDYSSELVGNDGRLTNGGLAVGDFDGDGDDDVAVSRDDAARLSLFLNWAPKSLTDDDADADRVPATVDSCPSTANADQANLDSLPFRCVSGAVCQTETGCQLRLFGDSAYLFCPGPVTWDDALARCRARGSELVTISDAPENTFLVTPATSWIGFHDHAVEGTFDWVGGSSTYVNWGAGQPDNSNNEDCTTLLASSIWNDDNCASKYGFICETTRFKKPDPGDACDSCASLWEPTAAPVAADAGACFAKDGGP